MRCPHCAVEVHPYWEQNQQQILESFPDPNEMERSVPGWYASAMVCPACEGVIVRVWRQQCVRPHQYEVVEDLIAYPQFSARVIAPEIQEPYRADFLEACAVLAISPKASAALSRRCLQLLLKENGYLAKDLAVQIDNVISSNILPAHLRDAIDAVRNIGNFAAHPLKTQASGEIVEVEPGEAEWTLDVLEGLFDFFIVQPKQLAAKRDALNVKLTAIGKPAMK
jgi:hypothetical protein